jgi:hypothetical protein
MKLAIGDMFVEVRPTENIYWIFICQDSDGIHLEAGKRKIRYGSRFQLRQLVSSGIYQYFPVVK